MCMWEREWFGGGEKVCFLVFYIFIYLFNNTVSNSCSRMIIEQQVWQHREGSYQGLIEAWSCIVSGGTEENHDKPEFWMAGALIMKYVTEQGISAGDLVVVRISSHTVVSLLHLHFSAQVFCLHLTLETLSKLWSMPFPFPLLVSSHSITAFIILWVHMQFSECTGEWPSMPYAGHCVKFPC